MNYFNISSRGVEIDESSPLPLHVQLSDRLKYHIEIGAWKPGERLPTVRDLAALLGINYNTIRAVYQDLERQGYLVARQGRGTFVAETPPGLGEDISDRLRGLVDDALIQIRQAGIPTDMLTRALTAGSARTLSGTPDVHVLFVECNEPDLRHFASTIEDAVGVAPVSMLLDDIRKWEAASFSEFQVVVTTLWHAEAVQEVIGPARAALALPATPAYEAVISPLSQLARGTPVGLVCLTDDRARGMERMLAGIGLDRVQYRPVGLDRFDAVEDVFDHAERIFISRMGLAARGDSWPDVDRVHPYITDLEPAALRLLRHEIILRS